MTIAASTVWEVRTTGSDTNGGGYSSGGIDWSQQDSPQYSVTDAVTNGTTTITSATANFGTDVVGNVLYIQGGTGSITARWCQVVSRTNATTIVVNAATGLTTGTGATLRLGGALASPGQCAAVATTAGNIIHMKAGTYTVTSASTNIANGCISLSANVTLIGYNATRLDDGTQPIVRANGVITSFTLYTGAGGSLVRNVECDGNNRPSSRGFAINASFGTNAFMCTARNCTNNGFNLASYGRCISCLATACSAQPAFVAAEHCQVSYCIAASNSGVAGFNGGQCNFCISYSNSIGFITTITQCNNCIAHGNSSHGFTADASFGHLRGQVFTNCIASNNTGRGYSFSGNAGFRSNLFISCASRSNTAGVTDGTGYSGTITELTADPFINAAGGNFALNNTAGGGAACRGAGMPGAFPGGLTTGYLDIGAVQHQDSGGGGVPLIGPGGLVY